MSDNGCGLGGGGLGYAPCSCQTGHIPDPGEDKSRAEQNSQNSDGGKGHQPTQAARKPRNDEQPPFSRRLLGGCGEKGRTPRSQSVGRWRNFFERGLDLRCRFQEGDELRIQRVSVYLVIQSLC